MVPWFIAYYASPITEGLHIRTDSVQAQRQVGIQTVEVTHTSGIHARDGDRVTIQYRFVAAGRVLADADLVGMPFTFTLGDGTVPDPVDDCAWGLQLWARRRAKVDAAQLGPGFAARWPDIHGQVEFEVVVVGLVRPGMP
ncbi:MAG: hypothetical protein JNM28_06155 [Armatimonadetes bacterium]|nr:hypothetical protein [Armatimonadota bacterium]